MKRVNKKTGEITYCSPFMKIEEERIYPANLEVRNICSAVAQWQRGNNTPLGKILTFVIIHIEDCWGNFGKGKLESWKQICFIPKPNSPGGLSSQLTYITHIKSGSLREFNDLVWSLMADKINPAAGFFTGELVPRQNSLGSFAEIEWNWEPGKEEDDKFFEKVQALLQENPILHSNSTETLAIIPAGSTPEEVAEIQESIKKICWTRKESSK